MNAKILIATVAALSLAGAGVANADHNKRHKPQKRHHGPPVAYIQTAPAAYGPRPAWAPPGSCFTDEGYGRYRPCDASPSSGR